MRNKKYHLLPYETIVKAAAGEPEAVNTVIQTYTGYIKYLSYFQGSINDDIQDYMKAYLMESLPKFRFDRWRVAKPEKAVKDKLCASRPWRPFLFLLLGRQEDGNEYAACSLTHDDLLRNKAWKGLVA